MIPLRRLALAHRRRAPPGERLQYRLRLPPVDPRVPALRRQPESPVVPVALASPRHGRGLYEPRHARFPLFSHAKLHLSGWLQLFCFKINRRLVSNGYSFNLF